MSKIKGLITPEQAKKLNSNYTARHSLISSHITKKEDNRSNWFSLEDIEAYLQYAKQQAIDLGFELNGIRIYNGAYDDDNGKPGLTTVFLIPTAENSLSKDGNGGNGDISGGNGLNIGQQGIPPGANYPQ